MAEVLVLNQNFEPLNICTMRRAVNMVPTGKAEVVLTNGHYVRTVSGASRRRRWCACATW